jgi:hypothetical protein
LTYINRNIKTLTLQTTQLKYHSIYLIIHESLPLSD